MRMWQTGLAVVVWGLALGMLLWGSGLDVALQLWLAGNVPNWLDKTSRIVSDLGLGRNQVLACLVLGRARAFRTVKKHASMLAALRLVPSWVVGCLHQLWLFARGRFVFTPLWQGIPRTPRLLLLALPVFAVAGLANIILKLAIGRPRPKEVLWNNAHPWQHLPLGDSSFMSFPSGHTATTAALAVVLAAILPARWRPLAWAWVVLVAAARVLAVTPHYLGDVIAGAALGIGIAFTILHTMGVRHVR
jgi:membrane-associated phospholipid phosphatase